MRGRFELFIGGGQHDRWHDRSRRPLRGLLAGVQRQRGEATLLVHVALLLLAVAILVNLHCVKCLCVVSLGHAEKP